MTTDDEREAALDALARSEARFRTVVEHAPDAVWIFNGARLCFVNPAAVKMLGYPDVETLLGTTPFKIIHPDEHDVARERTRRAFETNEVFPPREFRTVCRDGRVILVEVSSIRIDWEDAPALLSFGREVSARKEMERRLIQAERLASLGTLVAGIAHEINNPLTFCSMGVDEALRELQDGAGARTPEAALERVKEHLEAAQHGCARVTEIVRQLRAFAYNEPAERTAVALSDVIESAARIAQNELRHHARLELAFEPVPPVHGSGYRLEQVFLNLLLNAAHAMPEEDPLRNLIRVTLRPGAEGSVVAQVADNGRGIAPGVLSRIFDPFFTTSAPGVGMGLGLSICHSIVSDHGGTIEVASQEGMGTTFEVKLPASVIPAAPATRRPLAEAGARAGQQRRRRILVVDDEPALATFIARVFSNLYVTVCVSSGEEALGYLTEHPVDVVLCDLMMPGTTGMDLQQEVARRHPGLEKRFVFMTGGAFTQRASDFLARSRNPVVDKPFTVDALKTAIESIQI
jgi:PAS domain S-box-containing protein